LSTKAITSIPNAIIIISASYVVISLTPSRETRPTAALLPLLGNYTTNKPATQFVRSACVFMYVAISCFFMFDNTTQLVIYYKAVQGRPGRRPPKPSYYKKSNRVS